MLVGVGYEVGEEVRRVGKVMNVETDEEVGREGVLVEDVLVEDDLVDDGGLTDGPGVDEVVLVGTPGPGVEVLPASGRGGVQTGSVGAFVGRRVLGVCIIFVGPFHAGVA